MTRRLIFAIAGLAALAAPAFGQTTLRIGLQEDPDALDPHEARTFVGRIVFTALCDKLVDIDTKLEFVPRLATSWSFSEDGKTTDLTFTVPASDFNRARDTITGAKDKIGYARLDSATDVAKVSVIGSGMRSHAGVAAQAFTALAGKSINIRAITTSEIKFSVLIDAAYTELAVRTLHTLYGLDQA